MRPAMPFDFVVGGGLPPVADAYCSHCNYSRPRRFTTRRVFDVCQAAGEAGKPNARSLPAPDETQTIERSVSQKRRPL
jgi:hypothetical protein